MCAAGDETISDTIEEFTHEFNTRVLMQRGGGVAPRAIRNKFEKLALMDLQALLVSSCNASKQWSAINIVRPERRPEKMEFVPQV